MSNRLIFTLGLVVFAACGFSTELPVDAPGPNIQIGFALAASDADEKSSNHEITVKLSELAARDVTVGYEIANTTATPDDFSITASMITIPAGQLEASLVLQVKADTVEESNETIDLVLVNPDGAQIAAGAESHRVTILAKALPRVGFGAATSMAQEPMDDMMTVTLDEGSEFTITVDYTVTSTNALAGTDYMLADGTLTFLPTETSMPLVLDVLDDDLDEDNESVVVTLSNATNAVIDTTRVGHTHTILDDAVDPPPTVQFDAPTSTFGENAGTVNVVVRLSEVSGRTITVPYEVDSDSNATGGGTDYTLAQTMISIPPGTMTANIPIAINDDGIDEQTETVELDMLPATNATNSGQQEHELSITDNDMVCYGPASSDFDVCLQDAPTNMVNLTGGTINTNANSTDCSTLTIDFGPNQDPACFIVGDTITVNGSYTITGSRPLVLVAASLLTVNNKLDAASTSTGRAGPGSNSASCTNGTNGANDSSGGGGGAGGSFVGAGANGGSGDGGDANGGTAAMASAAPTKLRGGCAGSKGGNNGGGPGGRGGGAVYLVSGGNMSFSSNGIVNVSGAGGNGGDTQDGGGGGGSGGMIMLYATGTLSVNNSTKFVANGGGGGAGGSPGSGGGAGSDPVPETEATPAAGGTGGGAAGGDGFAGSTAPTAGAPGPANNAGGGGGGGGGYIRSNRTLGNADASAAMTSIIP